MLGENGHSTATLVDTVNGMISHRVNPAVGSWRRLDRDGDTSDQGVRGLGEAIRLAAIEVVAHLDLLGES